MRALITGASSGLGAEMARQFAAAGHDLALCARRVERLQELRAEILAAHPGRTVAVRSLDVDDHDDVFTAFRELAGELGGLDRVIVNAGLGKGAPVGTGRFDVNRQTLMTNLVSGVAQCEAALELFRASGRGHLVVVSSVSALRGMPGAMTAYAASKAGLASVAEGLRSELSGTDITITTLFPGYIESEMNDSSAGRTPLMATTTDGVRAMVSAIEREAATAAVPAWPWRPLSVVVRYAPLGVLRRLM
ncbi:MAG: SDR family oxidoreductase [Actinomycetota bacterium]|nr:SDR family oxidoreductase [Actinomycetota bacterium]